jgi:hypothetical protein
MHWTRVGAILSDWGPESVPAAAVGAVGATRLAAGA